MAAPALAFSKKQIAALGIHIIPARSPELLAYWDALKIIRDLMWLDSGLSYDGIIAAAGIARFLVARCKEHGLNSDELKGGRR